VFAIKMLQLSPIGPATMYGNFPPVTSGSRPMKELRRTLLGLTAITRDRTFVHMIVDEQPKTRNQCILGSL